MGSLLVRNLDDALIEALKARAARHGRSIEAEHRDILTEALEAERRAELFRRLDAFRARTEAFPQIPSEDLLREDRETR